MAEWFERFFDGLYAEALGSQFDERTSLQQARKVKRLLRVKKGQHVLDIPCGMGRLTLPLAKMGCRMTGVDLTALYLRRAARLARDQRLSIRLLRQDMRRIEFEGEFDAAFNWFGSFGYFSDADNLEFCRRVFRALRPGGRFLVDGPNKSWILAHFRPSHDTVIGQVRIVQRSRFDHRTQRVITTWTLSRGTRTERHTSRMRLFTGAELRRLLKAAGFGGIRLFGHDMRRAAVSRFTRHSRRLIAVARKPEG